ncbi:LysR family transcriptional regulator substrate-binding protein [Lactobacillus sp. LL6]|uniref:LysR family transcriptional regulator substrate-binding protein n=1 Tax=Lactobacillus sp. LL6 TaxID=2596827 RepID=UPI0011872500|nr:LysR family transcriptional regulator substrate-binding protein [Lactobacillus sp. LL6]TSO26278.1 LysR family transcriptional regulator substrate-binding protein [Lactobacillus sp. LL6]
METLNIGYFKNFGKKVIDQAKINFEKSHPNIKINLVSLYQDQVKNELEDKNIDLALTDPRDNNFDDYSVESIAEVSLIVLLQAGNFMKSEQTVEMEQLKNIPNILIATPKEEWGELHYHKDILKITSPFIAVDSFNEAALMAASGSGYFLMNENTAPLLKNDQLQKMFLLKDGKQLKQNYSVVYKNDSLVNRELITEFKKLLAN